MAKSKNHTNHNQNRKAHRNGIKRPKKTRFESTLGMDAKFLKNQRFSKKHNIKRNKKARRPKPKAIKQQINKTLPVAVVAK